MFACELLASLTHISLGHEVGQRLFAFIQPCIPQLAPSAVTDVFFLKVHPEVPAGPVGELERGYRIVRLACSACPTRCLSMTLKADREKLWG